MAGKDQEGMTTEEMLETLTDIGLRFCKTELDFAAPCLRHAATEFDNCGEHERAQAVRRAIAELDKAGEGLE